MRLLVALTMVTVAACPPAEGPNAPPVARMDTPTVADARLPVLLDATRSQDRDGTITTYTYLFGDGSPAVTRADSSYRHVFPGPGRFTMQLTVEDDAGATDSLTRLITLVDTFTPPYCTVTADCEPGQYCEPDGVCWEETP
jgi:PKD repeat protein